MVRKKADTSLKLGITRISDGKVIQRATYKPGSGRGSKSSSQIIAEFEAQEKLAAEKKAEEEKRIADEKAKLEKIRLDNISKAKSAAIVKQRIRTGKRVQPNQQQLQLRKQLIEPIKIKTPTQRLQEIPKPKPVITKGPSRALKIIRGAPKNVAAGVLEVGKEIVDISKGAVVGSFNYGKTLRKRFDAGENNPLTNDVKKLAKGTVSVGTYVKNNPAAAAAIVGAAGISLGKDFGTEFVNNPVKTTTKAALYLFPGTILKGGIKAAGTTKKGVDSVAAAVKLNKLNKATQGVRAGLTANQNAKLTKALPKISQLKLADGEKKLVTTLRKYATEQNIKLKRGLTSKQITKQLSSKSKVIPAGKPLKKPIIKKTQPKRPVTKVTIKGNKVVKVTKVSAKPTPKKVIRKKRDVTKFGIAIGRDVEKITKKQFKKITKKPQPIKLDVSELSKVAQSKLNVAKQQELAKKGIVKIGKTTYIDINAVTRIEKPATKVKPASKAFFKNKKAQVRFQTQIEKKVTNTVNKVKKIKKTKPTLKTKNKIIKDLKQLKSIINAGNAAKVIKLAGLIIIIDKAIKAAQGVTTIPSTGQKKGPGTGQKKVPDSGQKKKPGQDIGQAQTPGMKKKTGTKQIFKTPTPKKPGKPIIKKTPPEKPKLFPRVKKLPKVPKGSVRAYRVEFPRPGASNLVYTGLPINKARKLIRDTILDKKKSVKSAFLLKRGSTKVKDINKVDLKNFRIAEYQAQNLVGFIVRPKK